MENRFNPTISELEVGTVTRTYYDRMPARDTLGVELYPVDLDTAKAFKYNRGRVVATISCYAPNYDHTHSNVEETIKKRPVRNRSFFRVRDRTRTDDNQNHNLGL